MGKEKRHLTHLETFGFLSMEGVLPFSTTLHLHSQNKSQSFYFIDFLCINLLCQNFFFIMYYGLTGSNRENWLALNTVLFGVVCLDVTP